MYRVYTCLTHQHNLWLVLVAAVICLLSSLTAFCVISRARQAGNERVRNVWLMTAAVVIGSGIWATHFLGMLAFRPGLPIGYDLNLTIASVVIAIMITGAGIATSVWWPTRLGAVAGGALVGVGICCMHYTGMAAVRLQGFITYDTGLVVASALLGVSLSALAFLARQRWHGSRATVSGTSLLTLAICATHFTGMAAASLVPNTRMAMPETFLSTGWLAIAVAAAAFAILVLCLVIALLDQHLASLAADESVRLRTLTEAGTEAIVICADGLVEYGNSNFSKITGLSSNALAGRPFADFLGDGAYTSAVANMERGSGRAFETTLKTGTGGLIPIELVARYLQSGRTRKQVFALRDLTEQKRSQARIEHLAHHDPLTSLPNRARFNQRLAHDLEVAHRTQARLAVLCLDLDRFKDVNDTLGHPAGDTLLRGVADRLSKVVRRTDMVARLSGDEFAILQVSDEQPDGATQLANRILSAVNKVFHLEGSEVSVGVSIGIAVFPIDGMTPGDLLRHADTALYRVKSEGRNAYRFFEPGMDDDMRTRRQLEHDLKTALENDEMYLEYQPLAKATSREITGFEALVRWRHPERGRLGPNEFIAAAEDCGIVTEIGDWVLRRSCEDAISWRVPLNVSVNLSPVQFQRTDLVKSVTDILAETGLAPQRLELEITEGVLLADKARAIEILSSLKRLGVRIAMDDFGTGYSSLSYLQSFPFDKIKIDRTFVAGLETNADARAIVNAVIGLGQALKLPVLAEGVEDEFQLDFLRREGCTEVQGYLIGRPAEIGTFADIIGRRRKAAGRA